MDELTDAELADFKTRLDDLKAELEGLERLSAESRKPVELDQTTQGRLSRMDALQLQAMQNATGERRRLQLARIQSALNRMDEGEFGACIACGEEIERKRLDHDPSVPTCVGCASG